MNQYSYSNMSSDCDYFDFQDIGNMAYLDITDDNVCLRICHHIKGEKPRFTVIGENNASS